MYEQFSNLDQPEKISRSKKSKIFALIAIAALIIGGFYFWSKKQETAKPYIQGYRLVNEKISQSAAIAIYLPDGLEKSNTEKNIEFFPEIEGNWLKSDQGREIIFKPKEKLELNRYYSVELTLSQLDEISAQSIQFVSAQSEAGESIIKADFLVVENPEIIAIFPKENSEAPENSEITIVFNRPMVPLTTLGYLEEKDIPVEITPATEGRFKWITTRNLQFIPKERLKRASNYKVKIKSGMVSMDNLEVRGQEIEFFTRKLRYLNLTQGRIIYNQPISIYFNQPVDLEKIKNEISLENITTGEKTPFIIEYAEGQNQNELKEKKDEVFGNINISDVTAAVFNKLGFEWPFNKDEKEKQANESIIRIYNKKDKFGREKFWDFANSYSLKINKSYPIEGDIILNEMRIVNVNVSDVIERISAESERTKYAAPDFFDPQGKLWINFYEEIDLNKSEINVQKLKHIGYGEKCKDETQTISSNIECEKIADKKKILITFEQEKIGLGETLEINFKKIVNLSNLTINREPIIKHIISYPKFKLLKTSPENNSSQTNLTEFIICSNSPISAPAREDYKNYLKANLDYEINYWGNSWRVGYISSREVCDIDEFHTSIKYGLMPLADYSLELKLEDVFEQKLSRSLKFSTGAMPSFHLNFYHLQKNYNVTSPEKTKLTYAAENMDYVNIEICKLSPLNFLYYLDKKPKYYESGRSILNCQEIVRDKIYLPEKYWIKNYFKIDINDYFKEPLGHYILTLSHPNYRRQWGEKRQVYERSYLTITNLAVAEKKINSQYANYGTNETLNAKQLNELRNFYWVTNLDNLEPVPNASIKLYQKNLTPAGTYTTNDKGIALTQVITDLQGVIISKGKDSTVIPRYESRLDYASSAFSAKKIYLYTDKPIYRPGQEVFLKGIYRIGYDGSYEIYSGKKVNLKVYNSKGDEILNKDLEINDFGTLNTNLILDKGAPLGMYRACIDKFSCIYFDIQEYVPAPFEIKIETDEQEYISKDTVDLEIEANYYFGVPLEGGTVSYTISSQDYYFDRFSNGWFNFGSGWYYRYPHYYGEKFILRNETSLDANGKAKISQLFDLQKLFKNKEDRKSKIIVVDITIRNPQGQSVSAQKSFIVHNGEFYLGLKADKSFGPKNEKFNLKIKTVDTQGKETKIKNITLNLYKVKWIYNKRLGSDGGYHYEWEKQKDLVKTYNFNTNNQGNFTQELKISQEGSYEAEAEAEDKRGNLISSSYNLYIYGAKQVSIKPTKDTKLEIEAEKTDLKVGETAKIIIKSPYEKAKALISIERGKIFDYEIKNIKGNLYSYEFKIKEEHLPNVYVSVLLLSSEPEIKFGKIEFKINTERKELNIEVKSNKTQYLPGEKVALDILVKDYKGRPVSAELSLAVVDLSVLALKGNPKKNPLIFFYGGFPLTVSTASNIKNILIEFPIATKGGGGGADEALAKKKRGIFKETAFWQAVVRTDENGKALVEFILPDNLTTWQAETIGLTKDTKFGVNYQEFLTKKELMLVPLKPRFVVPGDTFYIGAKIFNQSKDKQKLNVKFDSQTLILENDKIEKKITINSNKTDTVYFQIKAPPQFEIGEHKFILSVKNQKLEDTVEQSINITRNNTYEVTATANYTQNNVSKEYVFLPDDIVKDRGNLSLKASATLAVFLSDSLNYLLKYPYGCSEQIASKLNAIAIVQKGLNLPNISDKFNLEKIKYRDKEYSIPEVVEIGLAELYNNQRSDGGFSYWKHGKSDFYLTLHLTDTLHNLSLAGFEINQNSLERAADYLDKEIRKGKWKYENESQYKNRIILTSYTLFRLPNFKDNYFLKQKIIQIAQNDLFIQEQISNNSLAYLAILSTKDFDANLKNKIFTVLDNRINIDSRGAFLETNKNIIWRYYETSIKNTALYLKALAVDKRDNQILDKVLRWLLNSRAKDGAWGSTNNTITVVDSFTDFLVWKKETESNFGLDLFINEQKQGDFNFNPETILDQFRKKISLSDLKFGKNNTIEFLKTNHNNLPNNLYYDLALKYYLPADQIPPRDEGFSISKEFYKLDDKENKNPLREAKVGDVLRGHIQITIPTSRNFTAIEDYIPAGMEIVNLSLATEEKSLRLQEKELQGRELRPDFKEIRDDRVFLFKETLKPGVYEFDYYVRALIKGKFIHLPAIASEMYFPENFGRTAGTYFEIK
ncbi:hypothetical protein KAS79_00725 [Candidatus Parcubacteria bacterium]|nr:hypothetical protein [Candidatus Parcubacteria bacterium]